MKRIFLTFPLFFLSVTATEASANCSEYSPITESCLHEMAGEIEDLQRAQKQMRDENLTLWTAINSLGDLILKQQKIIDKNHASADVIVPPPIIIPSEPSPLRPGKF